MANDITTYLEDDFENGAETVEIVFGILFAVGLGAALIAFQGVIYDGFDYAKTHVKAMFGNLETVGTTNTVAD